MLNHLKAALKQGLIFLLIPGLLIYIALTIISGLDNLWLPIFDFFFKKRLFWGAGLLATAALALIIGLFLISKFVKRPAIANFVSKILTHFPILEWLIGKDSLGKKELKKTKVVLVEYPSPGRYNIGFLVGTQKINGGEEMYKIFIPTVPIPATGYLVFINVKDKDKIIFLKNSPMEVSRLLLSGGFVDIILKKDDQIN